MKELKPGDLWISNGKTSRVAVHKRYGYETALFADNIRTIMRDRQYGERVCKFMGYSGWYVGRWINDRTPDTMAVISGPFPKLAPALVALKLEATNG